MMDGSPTPGHPSIRFDRSQSERDSMTAQPVSGRPVTFGLSLDPSANLLDQTKRLAHAAEDGGLDYLAVQDHPYNRGFLDVMTLIGHLASQTDRISFFPDVADLQLRPPTMLA